MSWFEWVQGFTRYERYYLEMAQGWNHISRRCRIGRVTWR